MQKFINNLQETEKIINTVDHMIYVTYPLIKDKKLLIKIILELKNAIANCITIILQYEYLFKRISLYKDSKTNFRTFQERCASRYELTSAETKSIVELFEIVKKHQQSSMEFVKNEKIIILSENLEQKTITIEKIKEFLELSKKLLKNIKITILRKI